MSGIKYSWVDQLLIVVDNSVRALFATPIARRPNPGNNQEETVLCRDEKKHSAGLMRINHAGEVCAQALYYGQSLATQSETIKKTLCKAAEEEIDHLAWCQTRIEELNDHTSYLNPLWYFGALSIGLLAGMIGDRWSLGFVVETERQVEKHLQNHLSCLPQNDEKSRLILKKMCEEEAQHATVAMGAGAIELPTFIKGIMKVLSKVMTKTTYYL